MVVDIGTRVFGPGYNSARYISHFHLQHAEENTLISEIIHQGCYYCPLAYHVQWLLSLSLQTSGKKHYNYM